MATGLERMGGATRPALKLCESEYLKAIGKLE